MLRSPVGGPWEGRKAGAQGQVGFRMRSNRGRSHRCDGWRDARNHHRNALQGKERRVQFKTKVPAALLLVPGKLGEPLVPLVGESVFWRSAGGGTMGHSAVAIPAGCAGMTMTEL